MEAEYSYREDEELSSFVTLTEQGQVLLNFDYAYDGNGNCVRKSGEKYQNEYAYDRMNRLVSAMQDGQEEKYAYDLVGNRLKKETSQGTETYHYNATSLLISRAAGTPSDTSITDKGICWRNKGKKAGSSTAMMRRTGMTVRACGMKRKRTAR